MAHAQRSMNKYFNLQGIVPHKIFYISTRKLTRRHDSRKSKLGKLTRTLRVVNAHLRACMKRHFGKPLPYKPCRTDVRHDKGIHSSVCRRFNGSQKLVKLAVVYHGIYRLIHLYSICVRQLYRLGKLLGIKVFGIYARVKSGASDIYRIGSAVYCRPESIH